MITQTIISLAVFYTLIDFVVKYGYDFDSDNFTLKYILGMNCYTCFSLRVALLIQIFNVLLFNDFNIISILAVYVIINITSRR